MNSCHKVVRSISYLEVMSRVHQAIPQKRTELWRNQSLILYHDNTSTHISMLVHEFLAKNETVILPQPPYSPDLARVDFFLFPKLKSTMKGKRFATIEEIKEKSIPKSMF